MSIRRPSTNNNHKSGGVDTSGAIEDKKNKADSDDMLYAEYLKALVFRRRMEIAHTRAIEKMKADQEVMLKLQRQQEELVRSTQQTQAELKALADEEDRLGEIDSQLKELEEVMETKTQEVEKLNNSITAELQKLPFVNVADSSKQAVEAKLEKIMKSLKYERLKEIGQHSDEFFTLVEDFSKLNQTNEQILKDCENHLLPECEKEMAKCVSDQYYLQLQEKTKCDLPEQ